MSEVVPTKSRSDWLQYVGTTLVGFLVAYFGFAGTKDTNLTAALKIEKEAVRHLRNELRDANETIFLKNSEIVQLMALVKAKVTDVQTLQRFLDSLLFPAWIKVFDEKAEGGFRMLMINSAYERYYRVRKDKYVGKTDFEIHPREIALMFNAHDRKVFESKDFIKIYERVEVDGVSIPLVVWKFSIKFADGRFGVVGFSWREPEPRKICDC